MHTDITVILLSFQASLAVITVIRVIKEFSINYFAKTVYSTKTYPLAVYRRFSEAKSEGPKWALLKSGGGMAPLALPPVPPLLFHTVDSKTLDYDGIVLQL